MTILERILEHKRREVEERRRAVPIGRIEEAIRSVGPPRDFKRAISSDGISLIAEIKKASPSAGVLREDLDPVGLASAYEAAGAAAISVITDRRFFMGELDYLRRVREAVDLPVLRKDFIIDEYQVIESRAWGADAALLIAAALEKRRLEELIRLVEEIGMTALVEVHDEAELEAALESGAQVIGINNRDLRTFEVSLEVTARLVPLIPEGKLIVSESGIKTRRDIELLSELEVDAVLIGEALVRSDDPKRAIKALFGGEPSPPKPGKTLKRR